MPGSLAFYLWQEQGMPPREVVHKLVEIARDAQAENARIITITRQTSLIWWMHAD